MTKKVVAIFGYNNTRLYDVKKIKAMLADMDIGVMLCKEGIIDADKEVSPYCFDVKLHGSVKEIDQACQRFMAWLKEQDVEVVGILPFSDKGVLLGSYVAVRLGIKADDDQAAIRGLDKYQFRVAESEAVLPSWYAKPDFERVSSISDIKKFYERVRAPIFIKPIAEGNSRGCMLVQSREDIDHGFSSVAPYLQDGAIAEQYVEDAKEYSIDSVGGHVWVTEKETSTGQYRTEIQQIVPAPIDETQYTRLVEAGRHVADLSGSKGGAFHNEVFLLSDDTTVTVEPNRRPGGSHIWDLAVIAFQDFNPFKTWIDWAVGVSMEDSVLRLNEYAGIRMISASVDGVISSFDEEKIKNLESTNDSVVEIHLSKPVGSLVQKNPQDNSGYLGFVIAKNKDAGELRRVLKHVSLEVSSAISIMASKEDNSEDSVVKLIRLHADTQKAVVLNCSYLSPVIDKWWSEVGHQEGFEINSENKSMLARLLLSSFENNEQQYFDSMAAPGCNIAAVTMTGLFSAESSLSLATIIHETLSDMFHLNDMKYPYENHKHLYVKQIGLSQPEWGNGSGKISPHCDDLYEDCETDYLSLTVVRNDLKVPTLFYMLSQVISDLTDEEIEKLTKIVPIFISGANVKGVVKEKERPVIEVKDGRVFISLDFRDDVRTGQRMRVSHEDDARLLGKIQASLGSSESVMVPSLAGAFSIFSNREVLHARSNLNVSADGGQFDLETTPRLLLRSKGPKDSGIVPKI